MQHSGLLVHTRKKKTDWNWPAQFRAQSPWMQAIYSAVRENMECDNDGVNWYEFHKTVVKTVGVNNMYVTVYVFLLFPWAKAWLRNRLICNEFRYPVPEQ